MTEYIMSDRHVSKGYLLAISATALGITLAFFVIPGLIVSAVLAGIVAGVSSIFIGTLISDLIGLAVYFTGGIIIFTIATEVIWPLMLIPAQTVVDAIYTVGSFVYGVASYVFSPVFSYFG